MGSICDYKNSGGITNIHSLSKSMVAVTVAHEIGHNLDMHHDTDNCKCETNSCIMADSTGDTPTNRWSSCSKDRFNSAIRRGLFHCLR